MRKIYRHYSQAGTVQLDSSQQRHPVERKVDELQEKFSVLSKHLVC